MAAVAPAPGGGPASGGVKPSLWKRLTATPLNTMLLIAFPLALLSLTLAVVALVNQVGGTSDKPEVVAANSPTALTSPSVLASNSPTPTGTPTTPVANVPVPVIPSQVPTFEPSAPTMELPLPAVTPSDLPSLPPLTTPSAVPTPVLPTVDPNLLTYTPGTNTPSPYTPVSTPTRTPAPTSAATTSQPGATTAPPGPVPVLVVDYPPVAVTSTDTGAGVVKDRLVPIVAGTAAPETKVKVSYAGIDGRAEASATADSSGQWSVGPLTAVGIDTTTIEINGTATNGEESWTFTAVNLAGPSVLISPKGDQTFSLRLTDRPGTTFEILLNGERMVKSQIIGTSGTWESMLPTLEPGNHQVGVRIVDDGRPGPVISTLVRVF